ncbi:MAG TPA: hypothetical protein VGG83_23775 [Trebonia sp.]|jgi:hypothetical protein
MVSRVYFARPLKDPQYRYRATGSAKRYDFTTLLRNSPKLELTLSLLLQPGAYAPPYEEQVSELLSLLNGTYKSGRGQARGGLATEC